jgi:hypothetical protein
MSMAADAPQRAPEPRLGACPDCEATIPRDDLLAEYTHPDEWPKMLAVCPGCGEVVSPR